MSTVRIDRIPLIFGRVASLCFLWLLCVGCAEKSSLTVVQATDAFLFSTTYLHVADAVAGSIGGAEDDAESIRFRFSIDPKDGRDILYEATEDSVADYDARLMTLLFECEDSFALSDSDGNVFQPTFCHMERTYGIKPGRSFIVSFFAPEGMVGSSSLQPVTLSFFDAELLADTLRFEYPSGLADLRETV